jgi:hypothetical protein
LATSAAFHGGLPAVFTVSIIEGGTMHHTADLTYSDRADLARSAVGVFSVSNLRGEFVPGDPISVVGAPEIAIRTGAGKTALVDLVADLFLTDRLGFGPSEITCLAQEHYYAEILEER